MRHAATEANLAHRYEGARTDSPLCERGVEQCRRINGGLLPTDVRKVYASTMLRARQTARLCFPFAHVVQTPRLEEFDSDRLTRPDPLPGRSVLSDLVLSLGDDGIWLELDYYDSQGVAEGEALRRRRGWRAQLATPKELGSVSRVDVDGAARWLRAGGGLVDVSRLDDVRAMLRIGQQNCPSDSPVRPCNQCCFPTEIKHRRSPFAWFSLNIITPGQG